MSPVCFWIIRSTQLTYYGFFSHTPFAINHPIRIIVFNLPRLLTPNASTPTDPHSNIIKFISPLNDAYMVEFTSMYCTYFYTYENVYFHYRSQNNNIRMSKIGMGYGILWQKNWQHINVFQCALWLGVRVYTQRRVQAARKHINLYVLLFRHSTHMNIDEITFIYRNRFNHCWLSFYICKVQYFETFSHCVPIYLPQHFPFPSFPKKNCFLVSQIEIWCVVKNSLSCVMCIWGEGRDQK